MTVIGYNRRCCREWVNRLDEAKCAFEYSENLDKIINAIPNKMKHHLAVIQEATTSWLCREGLPITKGSYDISAEVADEVRCIISAMDCRGLNATQEKRPQIVALVAKIKQLFPTMEQRFSASGHICLALTFLITCHSKNHKKDGL